MGTKATIGFEELRVECLIGCKEEERIIPQLLSLDLAVEIELTDSDNILETVNYVELASLCENITKAGEFHLLETLFKAIAVELRKDKRILNGTLMIRKPGALAQAKCSFIKGCI